MGKVKNVASGIGKKRQAVDHAFSAVFLTVVQLSMNFEMPVIILNAVVITAMMVREVGLLVLFEIREDADESVKTTLMHEIREQVMEEFGIHPDSVPGNLIPVKVPAEPSL